MKRDLASQGNNKICENLRIHLRDLREIVFWFPLIRRFKIMQIEADLFVMMFLQGFHREVAMYRVPCTVYRFGCAYYCTYWKKIILLPKVLH